MTNHELLEQGTAIGIAMGAAYARQDHATWWRLKHELDRIYSKLT
jgi:hypothetical protein